MALLYSHPLYFLPGANPASSCPASIYSQPLHSLPAASSLCSSRSPAARQASLPPQPTSIPYNSFLSPPPFAALPPQPTPNPYIPFPLPLPVRVPTLQQLVEHLHSPGPLPPPAILSCCHPPSQLPPSSSSPSPQSTYTVYVPYLPPSPLAALPPQLIPTLYTPFVRTSPFTTPAIQQLANHLHRLTLLQPPTVSSYHHSPFQLFRPNVLTIPTFPFCYHSLFQSRPPRTHQESPQPLHNLDLLSTPATHPWCHPPFQPPSSCRSPSISIASIYFSYLYFLAAATPPFRPSTLIYNHSPHSSCPFAIELLHSPLAATIFSRLGFPAGCQSSPPPQSALPPYIPCLQPHPLPALLPRRSSTPYFPFMLLLPSPATALNHLA